MENQTPATPVVTPQVVVEQPKQSNSLVVLLSILLLISVLIAGFFAYQTQKLVKELNSLKSGEKVNTEVTPDPTADWKTYTNKLCKYTVKVPLGWEIRNDPFVGEESIGFKPLDTDLISSNKKSIFIQAQPIENTGMDSLQDRIDAINDGGNVLWKNLTDKKIEKINFLNTEAIKVSGNMYNIPQTEIFFFNDGCYYNIEGKGEYLKMYDQILSTLKFVN